MGLQESMGRERAWQGRREPGIAEGADVERAAFGVIRGMHDQKDSEYAPFSAAITWVKDHQPALQFRPKIASDLRKMVAERCSDKGTPVKFFTAIGTPLDVYHGVDAFIEQGSRMVTIDISMQRKETTKADVLIVASMDKDGHVTVSDQEMQSAVAQIANELSRPMQRAA